MVGQHLGTASRRNALAQFLASQVEAHLVQQLVAVAVGGEVNAIAEQLGLAVIAQVVGQQQRTARQRLEDAHVDVVADAAVEDDACSGVSAGHVLEERPADERVLERAGQQPQQVLALAGKDIADEADIYALGNLVLAVQRGIAGQRQPHCFRDSLPAQPFGAVALGGEDEIAAAASSRHQSKLRWVSMTQQAAGRNSGGRWWARPSSICK